MTSTAQAGHMLERARWAAADVGPALRDLLAEGPAPEPVYGA